MFHSLILSFFISLYALSKDMLSHVKQYHDNVIDSWQESLFYQGQALNIVYNYFRATAKHWLAEALCIRLCGIFATICVAYVRAAAWRCRLT